ATRGALLERPHRLGEVGDAQTGHSARQPRRFEHPANPRGRSVDYRRRTRPPRAVESETELSARPNHNTSDTRSFTREQVKDGPPRPARRGRETVETLRLWPGSVYRGR